MDVFTSITLLPILVAMVIIIIALKFFSPNKAGHTNLPPGSLGWPIMGETIEFLFGKPEKFVSDRMKKYSPDIFKTHILGEKMVVICGPNGNKFLFANEHKLFTAFRPHSMQNIFGVPESPNPTADAQLAESVKSPGFFKPDVLVRYLPIMDSITKQQLEMYVHNKDEVNMSPFCRTLTLTLACRFFLGINDPHRIARLVNNFDDITVGMHSIVLNFPGTVFYRAKKSAVEVHRELIQVVKEKREAMAKGQKMYDIMSHLMMMSDTPDDEIVGKMTGMLTAGYSTVATAMTFLLKFVGERPDVYQKILAEHIKIEDSKEAGDILDWEDLQKMKYSWNVACEAMRLIPPIQGTFRTTLTDFTYAGYTIPKGWKVYWTVSSTNANPIYFKDPEKFDPSRFEEGNGCAPYTYVPFGGGPRMCPGKEYSRLVILIFLHNMVKKYKWETLLPDEKIIGDMVPTPEKGLPLRLKKRH